MEKSVEFKKASVILPLVTETQSLRETIATLVASSDGDIGEFLIVTCDRTTPASLQVAEEVKRRIGGRVVIYQQKKPWLGNAIREAFALATCSHVMLMATDMETDPATFPHLVAEAKKNPSAVVTASRWLTPGSFKGYGRHRVLLNFLFQTLTRMAYRTKARDLTFGYRLFPTALVQRVQWEYVKHDFLLETILKPLRLGVEVIEVPTSWLPRPDGESQNSLWKQMLYIRTALRVRFIPKSQLIAVKGQNEDQAGGVVSHNR